jgi:hypothetical protein
VRPLRCERGRGLPAADMTCRRLPANLRVPATTSRAVLLARGPFAPGMLRQGKLIKIVSESANGR